MVTVTHDAARAWQRAEEERVFWRTNQEAFLQKYPDQFVAVKDERVVATGYSLSDLLARLEEQRLEPTDVWVRFFDAHPGSTFF